MGKLKIGVVMDPVDKINIDKDTTFVLMLEAQRRGHEVYFMELDDLFIRGGTPMAAIAGSSWRARRHITTWARRAPARWKISIACGCAKIRPST